MAEIRELKEELQQLNARISEIKADINGKPHPEPTKLEPENPQDTLYDEVYDTVMTLGLGELEATAQAKAAAPNSSQAKPKTKISNEFSDKHPYSQLPGFKELNKTQKGREELRRAFLFGDNKPNATSVITKPPSPTESPEDEATKALEESGFSTATPPDQEQSALDQIPDGSIPTASDLGMTEEEYAIHIEAAKIQSKPTPPHTYSEQSSGLQGYQPEINNDRNDRWGISSETGHAYRLQTKDPALKELEAHDNTMLVELAEYNPELANDISALFETEPDVAEVMLRSALESAPKDDPDNPLEKNKFSVLEEFPTSEEKSAAKDRADAIAREKSRIEALLKKVAEKRIMTREEEVKIETAPAGKESGPLLDQEEIQKFHKEELSRKQNSTSPDFYDDSDGELGNFDSPSESGSDPETPTASPSSSPTPDSVRQESPSNSRSGTPEL